MRIVWINRSNNYLFAFDFVDFSGKQFYFLSFAWFSNFWFEWPIFQYQFVIVNQMKMLAFGFIYTHTHTHELLVFYSCKFTNHEPIQLDMLAKKEKKKSIDYTLKNARALFTSWHLCFLLPWFYFNIFDCTIWFSRS